MKKILSLLLCILMIVTIVGCKKKDESAAIVDLILAQREINYKQAEIEGNVSAKVFGQKIPINFSGKWDFESNLKAYFSASAFGNELGEVTVVDGWAYLNIPVESIQYKMQLPTDLIQNIFKEAKIKNGGSADIKQLTKYMKNARVRTLGENKVYSFEIDYKKALEDAKKLGNGEQDAPTPEEISDPKVSITASSNNTIKKINISGSVTAQKQTVGYSVNLELVSIGKEIEVSAPINADSYQEVDGTDIANKYLEL